MKRQHLTQSLLSPDWNDFPGTLEPPLKSMTGMDFSYAAMSRVLNEEGIKSYRNKKFYPSTVRYIVRRLELS